MTDIAANLSLIGRKAYENATPFRLRKVLAIPNNLQVTIDVGGGTGEPVPCLSSYRNRAPGDRVWCVMTDERGWIVLGRIGTPDTAAEIQELQDQIAELQEEIAALREHHPEPLPAPLDPAPETGE